MAERYRIKLNDEKIDLSRANTYSKIQYNNRINKYKTNQDVLEELLNSLDKNKVLNQWEKESTYKNIMKFINNESLLRQLSKNEDKYVRKLVASNPNCPEDVLRELSKDEAYDVRCNVASNPKTPDEVLNRLVDDGYRYLISNYLAENPNCSKETIKKMYNKISSGHVWMLKKLPNWDDSIEQEALKEDIKNMSSKAISIYLENNLNKIIKNKELASKVVNRLLYISTNGDAYKEYDIQELLKKGVRLNKEVFKDLIDKNNFFRYQDYLPLSPDCPLDILEWVLNEYPDDEEVRKRILKNPNCNNTLKTYISYLGLIDTDNPSIKDLIKVYNYNPKNKLVIEKLSENSNTPAEIFRQLAKNEDRWIRGRVAINPSTPEDILKILSEDEDRGIRERAEKNIEIYNVRNDLSFIRPSDSEVFYRSGGWFVMQGQGGYTSYSKNNLNLKEAINNLKRRLKVLYARKEKYPEDFELMLIIDNEELFNKSERQLITINYKTEYKYNKITTFNLKDCNLSDYMDEKYIHTHENVDFNKLPNWIKQLSNEMKQAGDNLIKEMVMNNKE